MSNLDLLSFREIRNFPGGQARLMVNRDDFYLYVDDSDAIRVFDSSSLATRALAPADKSIHGHAVAFDFSPSRQLAVIAYSDGGLVLFGLDDCKPQRLLTKPHGSCASAVAFRDDSSFLVGEGCVLTQWRLSRQLMIRQTVQETELFRFDSPITRLFLPRLFSFTGSGGKAGSHCLAPRFVDCVGVSTAKGFTFGWGSGSCPFTSSVEQAGGSPACGFDRADPGCLHFGVCGDTTLTVYTVEDDRSVKVSWSVTVPCSCIHLCFMSSSVVLGLGPDLRGFVVASEGSAIISDIGCARAGIFVEGQHGFRLCCDVLLDVSLQTFGGRMERLRESSDLSDFSNAIDLCRRVIANDAVATIGLPANASQRALVIERELSDLLSGETERRLKRSESESEVAEVADWLIGLNRELGMEDWLVGAGVGVFRDAGRLPILLRRLVELDVDASAFCYTADFGSLLLEHADCDIRHFVLKLPRDVVPLASLLEYGLSRGDDFLLSDLLDRGGDLSGALSVLGNAGCTSEVSLIILSHAESPSESEDNAMETAIVWLFTRSGGVFPRATQILESSVATSSLVFERVQSFIERTGRPFGLERFVDAMSIVLSNRCSDDALARRLDSLILNRRLKVSSGCAGRLMRRIFSPASGDDDDREALLIHLLSCDLPDKFSESLLGLCESFGFRSAKRQIQLGLEKYESVIREAAIDVDFDIFSFIGDLLKRSDGSRGSIQAAVLRNATILCARDGVGFSRFAREHLKESLSEVVTSVNDVRLRHSIAHELLRSGSLPTLNSETEASFFGFLCEFFPSEARSFAELREGDLRDLLEPATQFGVWDCCAVIHSRLGDVNRVCESFRSFIEECLVCYVEGGMSKCDGVVSFGVEFARTFLRSHNGNDAIRFAESSVRAFAIPLFALSERGSDSERTGTVVAFLCQIVTLALNVIPFSDFLRLFVVEFQELPFGFARYCLLSVLNDYEYDLDQNLSMVLLYHADEQNSHAKYIRGKIGGTVTGGLECDRCHCALFGVSCAIQLFECGHIFHRTNECLPKTVCPVCNPEERLGQDVGVAIQSIPRSRFRRELTRFENILSRKSGVSVATEPRVSDIRIPQRHIFPL